MILILALQPVAVWATPNLQEKRSKASQLKKEINALRQSSEIAVEQYNQAQIKLNKLQSDLVASREKLIKAEAELAANQEILNKRVAGIYKAGEAIDILELLLSARSIGDLIMAAESLEMVSENDAEIVRRTKKYRKIVEKTSKTLATQESQQAATTNYVKAKKNEILSQVSQQNRVLDKVKDEIAKAETAQEKARLAAIGRARAAALPQSSPRRVSAPQQTYAPVPSSGKGGAVVNYAMAEMGKPYVWGGAGPNSFDCSGLTMYVYRKVGISLPHSADAQYRMGRKINRDSLQPGDLIFGGSQGYITHVGIYIGGGNYINAPQTGDVVKISSLSSRRNYVGATRP